MNQRITALAKRITKSSSIQTYLTILLFADGNLAKDCFKAYAYFRWLDDQVDINLESKSKRLVFIKRQKRIISDLYQGKRIFKLSPEERIIEQLIKADTTENSKLKSFIINFFKIIEFDSERKDRFVTQKELDWYSQTLGIAVTDCLEYFIDHDKQYEESKNKYKAATAAHIIHMLRDLIKDVACGYINLPKEYLNKNQLKPDDINKPAFKRLIKKRVALARAYLKSGKQYLAGLKVLRRKIAGYWYCFRFERILSKIEEDEYRLKENYSRGRDLKNLSGFIQLTLVVLWAHFFTKNK
jgi:phytoene/squalene synthetase